ncbi:MAG TPA: hypothetical protein VJ508_07300, partial [Saprospiraceae bacterium]|nr:hypothetical protein [Saprospiraceae bacterium]
MIQVFIRITWLALFLIPILIPGQSQFPLRQWKSKLSVKEDIGFQSIKEVGDEINAVDTTRRCEALHQLLQEAEDGNTRFQIRAAVIWSDLYPNVRGCQDSIPNVEKLEQALRKCYEINDRSLAVTVHRALANEYSILNKPGLSIVHQLAMKEDMELTGLQHYRNYAMVLYALADHLYHSRDYRSAARLNQQALRYHGTDPYNTMDSLSDYWKMNTWNNLGLCFKQLMVYDSAMWAFDHAYNLTTDPFWRGLLKGNRGDVFFQQGKYDSAEALLRIDYKQSLVSGEFTNASVTIQRLARITAARGDPKTALRMMRMADSLEQRSPN